MVNLNFFKKNYYKFYILVLKVKLLEFERN
jgi:hypothetical protein